MANSTGIVIAAGAISLLDVVMSDRWVPADAVRVCAASVGAAWVSAGLDKVIPGFGTGAAVLLLVAVLMRSTPTLAAKILPGTEVHTSGFEAR